MVRPDEALLYLSLLLATACGGGTTGPDGNPTVIAEAGGIPIALVVDTDDVYWVTQGSTGTNGRLLKAPKRGGVAVTLATELRWPKNAIALDDRNVYVITLDGLFKLAKDATSSAERVADAATAVSIGGDSIYWSTGEAIFRAPGPGGAQTMVLGQLEYADVLVVDDDHVYWINRLNGLLMRAQLDGTTTTRLDSMVGDSTPTLALDDANVYWGLNGKVSRVRKTDGAVTVLSDMEHSARGIWTDGRSLYTIHATSEASAEIRRMPVGGGNFESALTNLRSANAVLSLALDDAYVYWGDSPQDGVAATIRRVLK